MYSRPKLQVKALLLDLDGTLVDCTEALKEAGTAGFAALKTADVNDKKTALEVARRLEQDLPIDDLLGGFLVGRDSRERFLSAYLNAYYSAVVSKAKLFPKINETLEILSQGLSLALITLRHVAKKQIIYELARLGIQKHFRVVVTALDVKKPKPFPDALIAASHKLGVSIGKCAIVGDSIVDIQAGKAAGAKTIAVLTGLFRYEELEKEKPDLIITDLTSLPSFLAVTRINI